MTRRDPDHPALQGWGTPGWRGPGWWDAAIARAGRHEGETVTVSWAAVDWLLTGFAGSSYSARDTVVIAETRAALENA